MRKWDAQVEMNQPQTSTRDVIIDAAEALVRNEGPQALTVRSLADRTHYGKSTVHDSVGGMDELWTVLRRRATDELISLADGLAPGESADYEWLDLFARRFGSWAIENPHWAELVFSSPNDDTLPAWQAAATKLMLPTLPPGAAAMSGPEAEGMVRYATALTAASVRLVIDCGDAELAVSAFRTQHAAVSAAIIGLTETQA